jgi:tetratricopeptide (TPR) repeat protein
VTWIGKGFTLNGLKRYSDADDAYEQALRLDPNSKVAMVYRAENLINLSRTPQAIDLLNRATDKYPNYEDAWYVKGLALIETQNYKDSLDAFNSTISLNKGNAYAWFYKGEVLYLLATKEYGNSQSMLLAAKIALNNSKELDEDLAESADKIIFEKIDPKLPSGLQNTKTRREPVSSAFAATVLNETLVNNPSNKTTNQGIWSF